MDFKRSDNIIDSLKLGKRRLVNIEQRTNITKVVKAMIPIIYEKAFTFIETKYPDLVFGNLCLIFSPSGGSKFFPNNDDPKYPDPTIKIGLKSTIAFAAYKKCGLMTPIDGLNVGIELTSVLNLIHLLTYYHKDFVSNEGRYSSVDATQNKIDYLKEFEPYWYSKLIPIAKQ